MRNKEIENRILNSLEDKSAGLDPRVLDAVKSEIGEQKKTKRGKNVLRFAVAALIVAALCLAVALPITLIKSPSEGYTENGFTSMNEYFSEHGIPLKSLKEIMDDGSLAGTGQNNGLEKSECTLISNGKGEDVIIEETYTFIGGDVVLQLLFRVNFSGKLEIGRLAKTVDADFGDFRLLRAEVERDLLIPVIFIDILKQTELEDLPLPGAVVLQLPVGAGINMDSDGTVGVAVEQL